MLDTGIHGAETEHALSAAEWILAFASMTVEGVAFVARGIRIGLGLAHANGCRRMLRKGGLSAEARRA